MSDLTEQLKTARGKRYYAILKAILVVDGDAIVADAQEIRRTTGKLTPTDVGMLAQRYDLNFKATCQWLEERNVIPVGMYEVLKDRDLKVRDVMAAEKP